MKILRFKSGVFASKFVFSLKCSKSATLLLCDVVELLHEMETKEVVLHVLQGLICVGVIAFVGWFAGLRFPLEINQTGYLSNLENGIHYAAYRIQFTEALAWQSACLVEKLLIDQLEVNAKNSTRREGHRKKITEQVGRIKEKHIHEHKCPSIMRDGDAAHCNHPAYGHTPDEEIACFLTHASTEFFFIEDWNDLTLKTLTKVLDSSPQEYQLTFPRPDFKWREKL